ncbi:hypothetical protein [Treponema pedis]|uniref:hypothetical protein n=1 Tax=Treponema pedis TaxID=409322 RepID=UPI0004222C8F|nr:hypothetical protein [Treponema pedis]
MGYKTCDWCGKSYKPMFSADRDAGNAFADAMGLTIGVKAIGGIARLAGKRNFCSKGCKLAYEQSKNASAGTNNEPVENGSATQKPGGGIMSGIGGMFGDMFSSTREQLKDNMDQIKNNRAKTEEIVNFQFGSTSEEIQNQLQNMFTQISALPRLKSPEQKALYNAIKEKLEFGIMKLNSNGANAEAEFFQKKFDKLK